MTDDQQPNSEDPSAGAWWRGLLAWLPGIILAAPAIWQLWLMVRAWWGRFFYPYDLEWMEGGMLVHAWRLLRGETIYPPPSIEFIPYLYTPLYSAAVAAGSVFSGVTYQIGRGINVLSMVIVLMLLALAAKAEVAGEDNASETWMTWVAVFMGVGLVASGYPWTDGWYDIARPDSFLCAVGLLGFVGLRGELMKRTDETAGERGWRQFWHPSIAGWAAFLALSFFIKQTGVLFVAGAGVAVLAARWRAVPSFVLAAGAVGLGGTLLLNLATGGWFWRYIFVYHQRHSNSFERFVEAWGAMFQHMPVVCIAAGVGFVVALVIRVVHLIADQTGWLSKGFHEFAERRIVGGMVYWGWLAAIGALFGATGFSTQWAVSNAYMAFIVFGAVATAVSVPFIYEVFVGAGVRSSAAVAAATLVMAGGSLQLAASGWNPSKYVPGPKQEEAGDQLVKMIRGIEGPVFAPYFPWYLRLADKKPWMHIMSRNDVLRLSPAECPPPGGTGPFICPSLPPEGKQIQGWTDALTSENFEAVIMPPTSGLISQLDDFQLGERLARSQIPTPPTGYQFGGMALMRAERSRSLPASGKMLFDFEDPLSSGWRVSGRAWGEGPVTSTLNRQQPVGGYGGDRYMNSYHGGDGPTGVAKSPTFEIAGDALHLWVGGGRLKDGVRAELRVGGEVVRKAAGDRTEMMRHVTWDVGQWRGKKAQLWLVDHASGGWGHLTVDDVWFEGAQDLGSSGESFKSGDPNDDG